MVAGYLAPRVYQAVLGEQGTKEHLVETTVSQEYQDVSAAEVNKEKGAYQGLQARLEPVGFKDLEV